MIVLRAKYCDNESDVVSIDEEILTINSVDFDLNNMDSINVEDNVSQKSVYKVADTIYININVPKNRLFMFHSGNLLRFYSIDTNKIESINDLELIINYINETDEDSLKSNLKSIKTSFESITKDKGLNYIQVKKEWWNKGFN